MLHTTTNAGLHDFVVERVLTRYTRPGLRAADLGTGPGAMAARLHSLGCEVLAADRDAADFAAGLPPVFLVFYRPGFSTHLRLQSFCLFTPLKVIENVGGSVRFLLHIGR